MLERSMLTNTLADSDSEGVAKGRLDSDYMVDFVEAISSVGLDDDLAFGFLSEEAGRGTLRVVGACMFFSG